MYRPEGMKKNPFQDERLKIITRDGEDSKINLHAVFEAGADALLEGLKKQNVTLPDVIHHYTLGKLGHLVFIPAGKMPEVIEEGE